MQQEAPSIFDDLSQTPYFKYATTGQRFVNFIIDYIAYCIIGSVFNTFLLIILPLTGGDITDVFERLIIILALQVLFYILLYTLVEGASKGRSLGKLITKTQQ